MVQIVWFNRSEVICVRDAEGARKGGAEHGSEAHPGAARPRAVRPTQEGRRTGARPKEKNYLLD
ncbi:hypothetical protein AT05_06025 [Schleiferia thermophila str. Yellowstone]|jgi:hypothetical protein|nr:hypothetical protein AT05_06025 [Schleiferia thermophila str. Yellowstone]PMB28076.1 hypothetical protein CEN47_14480 [Fischerella thermalis CCMEE 5319]